MPRDGSQTAARQKGQGGQTWPGKGWNVILRVYGPLMSTGPGDRARLKVE
jgi:hypothetical protein